MSSRTEKKGDELLWERKKNTLVVTSVGRVSCLMNDLLRIRLFEHCRERMERPCVCVCMCVCVCVCACVPGLGEETLILTTDSGVR